MSFSILELKKKMHGESAPSTMQRLTADKTLRTNAAPFQGPIMVYGHVKAMPTVLQRRVVANFCVPCLLISTEDLQQSPQLDFLLGPEKSISLIPSVPRCFYIMLHFTEVLELQEEY